MYHHNCVCMYIKNESEKMSHIYVDMADVLRTRRRKGGKKETYSVHWRKRSTSTSLTPQINRSISSSVKRGKSS